MTNVNEKRYPDIDQAVAFRIAFAPMIYTYGDVGWDEIEFELCSRCGITEQIIDFLAPKSYCDKKDRAILDTYHYGVSIEVRNQLIQAFEDISEQDFRACRNKAGDVVFYQITPQYTMLPMAEKLRYRQLKPCRKCGSIQYRYKERKNEQNWPYWYITEEALNDLHSLNVSFEHFEMHLPHWVVSRDVYEFLMKRYPRMEFQPIFLYDEQVGL